MCAQEEFQKDAFEALQLQKDAKTQRIFQQINMIEEELASLTLVELQRKEERTDDEIVSRYSLLLGHSGDLLPWVGVRRRPSCVVRRA